VTENNTDNFLSLKIDVTLSKTATLQTVL